MFTVGNIHFYVEIIFNVFFSFSGSILKGVLKKIKYFLINPIEYNYREIIKLNLCKILNMFKTFKLERILRI